MKKKLVNDLIYRALHEGFSKKEIKEALLYSAWLSNKVNKANPYDIGDAFSLARQVMPKQEDRIFRIEHELMKALKKNDKDLIKSSLDDAAEVFEWAETYDEDYSEQFMGAIKSIQNLVKKYNIEV